MTLVYANQILQSLNTKNSTQLTNVTYDMLKEYESGNDLDFDRYVVDSESGDYKIIILKYNLDVEDDNGSKIYDDSDLSDSAVILFKDNEVSAYCDDFNDDDYHEFNAYFNGLSENCMYYMVLDERLRAMVTTVFTAPEDSNAADYQLFAESVASLLNIDVTKFERKIGE